MVRSEDQLWTVGFTSPDTNEWEVDSDHSSAETAFDRAQWLNGPLDGEMVYRRTEPGLWTIGYFDGHGTWMPVDDWTSQDEAARRVADRNGSDYDGWDESRGGRV